MDGVVVVAERGGALQYARSFSARFDRRHVKSERLNLASLLFALQQFAGNSLHAVDPTGAEECPPIARFETRAERIVMARSRTQGLLIALFMHPTVDASVAQSLVARIAHYYDHELGAEARLAVALNQNARIFREACERALRDEVDACLHGFADSLYGQCNINQRSSVGFVLYQFSSSRASRRTVGHTATGIDHDDDEDDCKDDAAIVTPTNASVDSGKESRLASPRPTDSRSSAEPAPRLQKLFASTRSLLPLPKVRGDGGHGAPKGKVKKNAVMNLADPKHFERFVRFPRTPAPGGGGDDLLGKLIDHPQFPLALMDALEPHVVHFVDLIQSSTNIASGVRTVQSGTWRHFPLPALLPPARVCVDLQFWLCGGSLLVHTKALLLEDSCTEKLRAAALLDRVTPLARCAVKLSP